MSRVRVEAWHGVFRVSRVVEKPLPRLLEETRPSSFLSQATARVTMIQQQRQSLESLTVDA